MRIPTEVRGGGKSKAPSGSGERKQLSLADDGDDARGEPIRRVQKGWLTVTGPLKLHKNNSFYLRRLFPRVGLVGVAMEA